MSEKKSERHCPVCDSSSSTPFVSEHVDMGKMTDFSYSSRKTPEFMRLRMIRCLSCDLVFAPIPPTYNILHNAYSEAAYDSSEEALYAAKTYANLLESHINRLYTRTCAVDIGAGNGALLPELLRMGFNKVVGIEPSHHALSASPPAILPYMREGMFSSKIIHDITPDLIVSCMTLEHVENPKKMLHIAYETMLPGGMIAIVVHNRKGILNKLLGLRSPIMDIEHLQLFCPNSVEILLKKTGFTNIFVQTFANTYPLKYWLRLSPIPIFLKKGLHNFFGKLGMLDIPLKIPVGNMLATGKKKI